MAIEADHISLANKSHRSLELLLSDYANHPEWVATIAFYKAVHVVEAVFHNTWNVHSRNHDDRRDQIKRRLPQTLFKNFEALYQKSRIARYLEDSESKTAYRTFVDHISPDEVVTNLVGKRLVTVEQMAIGYLSEPAKAALTQIHGPSLPV